MGITPLALTGYIVAVAFGLFVAGLIGLVFLLVYYAVRGWLEQTKET